MIQREEDFTTLIQEVSSKTTPEAKISNLASSSSWSRLKDPRIVRVSRLFGGKDRHSKVSTVKGLRDRRVRLSVPTAIQLYDLQDRLGLNQPSKVVDWLLNAAKNEIDELPPLQMPHGLSFTTQSPSFLDFGASSHSDKLQGLKISCGLNDTLKHQRSSGTRDENWERNEDENQYFASRQNPTSLFLNSSISPNNPLIRWDPSKLTLSQPTQSHGLSTDEDLHTNFSQLPMSSTLSFTSGSQHLMYHQPEMATQSYFHSQMNTEFDPNYQLSVNSSSAHSVRPFHFSMTESLLSSRNNQQNNNNLEFHDSR